MRDARHETQFTYGEAEALLAGLHNAADVQRLAFRGRMKHLKRVGIPLDTRIGQGKKTLYDEDHIYQWAFALELEQLNVDPTSIGKIMAAHWTDIRQAYQAAKEADATTAVLFWLVPQFMNSTWSQTLGVLEIGCVAAEHLQTVLRHTLHRYSIFSVSDAVRAVLKAKPALAFSGEKRGVAAWSMRLS